MIILALLGCIVLGDFIAESKPIYTIKWYLAKYKIWYVKENKHLPIGTQLRTLKPFDCKHCLAFWFALSCMIIDGYHVVIAFTTAMLIYKISTILNK